MHHNIRPFAKDWWDALPYYGGAFFCAVLQGVGFRLRHISRAEN